MRLRGVHGCQKCKFRKKPIRAARRTSVYAAPWAKCTDARFETPNPAPRANLSPPDQDDIPYATEATSIIYVGVINGGRIEGDRPETAAIQVKTKTNGSRLQIGVILQLP